MEFISMILIPVILFLLIGLFVLFYREKKRNNQRYKAMLNYVDRNAEDVNANCDDAAKQLIEEHANKILEIVRLEVNKTIAEQESKMQGQLNDLLLDYSQAQAAASRINDFGASLASIFDYDPMKAIQKGRKKEAG